MRKYLPYIITALFFLCGCQESKNDLLKAVIQKGEITIATEGTWAPWTFHDKDGNLTGFDIEVARAIAKKLGVQAHFIETEWSGIFDGLTSGAYDISCNGIEITSERLEKYDFSVPYGLIRTALIVRNDNHDISSIDDITGRPLSQTFGSTYSMVAEKHGAVIVKCETMEEALNLVEKGEADAHLNADVSFYEYMKAYPQTPLKTVAIGKRASPVAIPLRKGQKVSSLREAINKAILELEEEGVLTEISEKYFGSDITQ